MPEFNNLRNRVAVVGVGTTAYGSFPETDEYGLAAEAFRNALDDCRLDKNKIDGLLTCRIPSYSRMGEVLGLDPRWTITLPGHGRMSGIGLIEATIALATGPGEQCRAALRQYWPIAARLLRRRRIARILGPVGIYVSRRGACADVPASHGALRNNHEAARGSVRGLSPCTRSSIRTRS